MSILLAAAARNGRWDDMLERYRDLTRPRIDGPKDYPPRANPSYALRPYLDEVARCGPEQMRARVDHYTFCPDRRDVSAGERGGPSSLWIAVEQEERARREAARSSASARATGRSVTSRAAAQVDHRREGGPEHSPEG